MEKQKSIRRNAHCEYTPEHFKIYAACEELKIFVRVYASDDNNMPVIFDGLRQMYEGQ